MLTCIVLLVLISSISGSGPFKKCDTENLIDLNNCLTETINENIKSFITTGFPEWKLASVDPYNYKTTTVDFKIAGFENVVSETELRGISKINFKSITLNPSTMIVKWQGEIPELRITGQYNLSGQLFALQLVGQGPFWAILSNTTSVMEQTLVLNNNRIQVENNTIHLNIGKFRARLNKLFNGDAVIGETVNAFVNENSGEFVEIFKPVISEPIKAVFNEIITRQLNEIPVQKFL